MEGKLVKNKRTGKEEFFTEDDWRNAVALKMHTHYTIIRTIHPTDSTEQQKEIMQHIESLLPKEPVSFTQEKKEDAVVADENEVYADNPGIVGVKRKRKPKQTNKSENNE